MLIDDMAILFKRKTATEMDCRHFGTEKPITIWRFLYSFQAERSGIFLFAARLYFSFAHLAGQFVQHAIDILMAIDAAE